MKQVMNYHKDNGLLNMIRRTDPMISGEKYKNLPGYHHGIIKRTPLIKNFLPVK